jgi:release factor glutamine methyltransferase
LTAITVKTALSSASQRLQAAGCDTPFLDAEVLLAHALNQSPTWLVAHRDAPLAADQVQLFAECVTQREKRKPVAYIVGHKEFFGLDFTVAPEVLIPRPETELLVEEAIKILTGKKAPTIADVGTGSGCIAIALACHLPGATIDAIDISSAALHVAQANAVRHLVANRIKFSTGNLLASLKKPVDLIISNPPYVGRSYLCAPTTMPEVRQFEPRLALDGGYTGLDIIEELLAQSRNKLVSDGTLLVEIGYDQGEQVLSLAGKYFPKAKRSIKQDLARLDRVLMVQQDDQQV